MTKKRNTTAIFLEELETNREYNGIHLTLVQIRIYALLARLSKKTGICYPSQKYIAKKVGCSIRTVVSATAVLEKAGLIIVTRTMRKNGKNDVNHYHLTLFEKQKKINTVTVDKIQSQRETNCELQSANNADKKNHISLKKIHDSTKTTCSKDVELNRLKLDLFCENATQQGIDQTIVNLVKNKYYVILRTKYKKNSNQHISYLVDGEILSCHEVKYALNCLTYKDLLDIAMHLQYQKNKDNNWRIHNDFSYLLKLFCLSANGVSLTDGYTSNDGQDSIDLPIESSSEPVSYYSLPLNNLTGAEKTLFKTLSGLLRRDMLPVELYDIHIALSQKAGLFSTHKKPLCVDA